MRYHDLRIMALWVVKAIKLPHFRSLIRGVPLDAIRKYYCSLKFDHTSLSACITASTLSSPQRNLLLRGWGGGGCKVCWLLRELSRPLRVVADTPGNIS